MVTLRRALSRPADLTRTFELRSELDALVRLDARLSSEDVATVSSIGSLRTQALVFASREPARHVEALVSMREGSRDKERVAIDNLIAAGAPRRAVELLLPAASIRVIVDVNDGNGGRSSGVRSSGIGCGSLRAPAGFPPVALYDLVEGGARNATLLADGPRPIGVSRQVRHEPEFGIGGTIEELDEAQHALQLLRWIARDEQGESLSSSNVRVRHAWVDVRTYVEAVEREIRPRERAWQALMDRLTRAGHLDTSRVPAKAPIELVVVDDRADRSVDLPKLDR